MKRQLDSEPSIASTVGGIIVAGLVTLMLFAVGMHFRHAELSGIDGEAHARQIAQQLLWVVLGFAPTLLASPFVLSGPLVGDLCIRTGILLAALQVGSRLCLAWHLTTIRIILDAKELAAGSVSGSPAPEMGRILLPYILIISVCGSVAFIALIAAVRLLPSLWSTTRNKVGASLWAVGTAFAILHVVPMMRWAIMGHAWMLAWNPHG